MGLGRSEGEGADGRGSCGPRCQAGPRGSGLVREKAGREEEALAGPARSGPGAEGREKGGGVFIYLFIYFQFKFFFLFSFSKSQVKFQTNSSIVSIYFSTQIKIDNFVRLSKITLQL